MNCIIVSCIDATEEYIRGSTIGSSSSQETRIPTSGLGCVTVLIGGYDIESGKPIIGIINQPFAELTDTGLSSINFAFMAFQVAKHFFCFHFFLVILSDTKARLSGELIWMQLG